mmetsp:Transcript_22361/g.72556  ORF Transcript_22361/g.72556 Transcript_22361/m.72556 type:complete len:224 (-) Transcript_22361:68-739(-)
MRRRARSHNVYHGRRRPNKKRLLGGAGGAGIPVGRRARRRRERLQAQVERAAAAAPGAVAGGRRLETHLWAAGRFRMVSQWGHVMALGAFGRGRGSRSVRRALAESALVHDASYWTPFELAGPRAALRRTLGLCTGGERVFARARGARETEVTLHASGRHPRGALGPARVLFLEAAGSEEGKLLIWVHAAAFQASAEALAVREGARSSSALGQGRAPSPSHCC